tara:strand:+ start:91 stop:615 length:525 start_codon:yes stop_codon:yes gene_type:complete
MISRSKGRKITLGTFGKPHGVKGFIFLKYYGDDHKNIKTFSELNVGQEKNIKIEDLLITGKKLVVKIKGVEDRETAELYRNKEIFTFEECLPALQKDEYYWYQLERLEVRNEQGENLGIVDHLLSTGANDVMLVKPSDKSIDDKERLVPFVKEETIVEVKLKKKIINVKWPKEY